MPYEELSLVLHNWRLSPHKHTPHQKARVHRWYRVLCVAHQVPGASHTYLSEEQEPDYIFTHGHYIEEPMEEETTEESPF